MIGNLLRLSDNAASAVARHQGPLSLSVCMPVSELAHRALKTRVNEGDEFDIEAEAILPKHLASQTPDNEDRKKVQELLETGAAEAVAIGLRQLETLRLSAKECETVLTEKALRSTSAVAAQWLQGDHALMEEYRRYHRLVARPRFLSLWGEASRVAGSFLESGICSVGALVDIPAGAFTMGSPETDTVRRPDENQAFVRITKPFQIGITPVTLGQWLAVMGATVNSYDDFDCPVTSISWRDAVLFCELLTTLEQELGVLSATRDYRLPTEAEWEYACRAGTTTVYSFGCNDLPSYGWYIENSGTWGDEEGEYVAKHLVALKKSNPWGLFDMHGNVLEWCYDWYSDRLAGGDDPRGPPDGSHRVCRGAYGWSQAEDCRSAARGQRDPDYRGYAGFRVVRTGP